MIDVQKFIAAVTSKIDFMEFIEFLLGKLFKGFYGKVIINIEDGRIVRWNLDQSFKPNNNTTQKEYTKQS